MVYAQDADELSIKMSTNITLFLNNFLIAMSALGSRVEILLCQH